MHLLRLCISDGSDGEDTAFAEFLPRSAKRRWRMRCDGECAAMRCGAKVNRRHVKQEFYFSTRAHRLAHRPVSHTPFSLYFATRSAAASCHSAHAAPSWSAMGFAQSNFKAFAQSLIFFIAAACSLIFSACEQTTSKTFVRPTDDLGH